MEKRRPAMIKKRRPTYCCLAGSTARGAVRILAQAGHQAAQTNIRALIISNVLPVQEEAVQRAEAEWSLILHLEGDPLYVVMQELLYHKDWQSFREPLTALAEDAYQLPLTRKSLTIVGAYWIDGSSYSNELGFLALRRASRSHAFAFHASNSNMQAVAIRQVRLFSSVLVI
jgi:hypothetical protein